MAAADAAGGAGSAPIGRPRVVIVGLGPAGPEHTTLAAQEALAHASAVLVRTERHPAAAPLVGRGAVALDRCYEASASFEEVYRAIVEEVVDAARRHGEVAYAVPGSPYVLAVSASMLLRDPRVEVEVVPGMSFLDLAWASPGIYPIAASIRLVDAQEFTTAAAGERGPMLIAHLWSRALCSQVKLALEAFPAEPVTMLHHLGLPDERVVEVAWEDLDRALEVDHLTCAYVPTLGAPVASELVRLDELVHDLRARCAYDAEQTHRTLTRHLLEEAHEAIEALDELGDRPEEAGAAAVDHAEEELGDVLVQVLFHATLGAEEGLFSLADIARSVHDKLVRRHPHLYGDEVGIERSADEQRRRWEEIKQAERQRESVTDGIPPGLPALAHVTKLERKLDALGLGVETLGIAGAAQVAWIDALEGSEERLGEALLGLARLAADRRLDAEEALRRALARWRSALRAVEAEVRREGSTLGALEVAERRERFRRLAAPDLH